DFATRQVVLDDVDITHVIDGSIIATDLHHDGGVRLESDADASLVVKFSPGSQIVAGGVPLDIDDRIGGIVQIVGTPGFPVVLTSLDDDSIGAGFDPSGSPLRDTRSDGLTVGRPGQWAGITFTEFTHDRNVATILEREESIGGGGDLNASIDNAQTLGQLAAREKASDENLRLGFSVFGQIAEPGDVDTFGFRGTGGDTVWIDLDRTASTLDTMLEIIDGQGRVLASNNDSHDNGVVTTAFGTDANVMLQSAYSLRNRISDTPRDLYTTNVTDSGLRLILPGTEGVVQQYYARVTGRDGSTGVYELQIRGRELDEHAGSTVRNAEIRFAAAGITVEGGPIHSALVGEGRTVTTGTAPNLSNQDLELGNIHNSDRAAVSINANFDFDGGQRFDFTIDRDSIEGHTDEGAPTGTYISTTIDVDYADGFGGPDTTLALYYLGAVGNLAPQLVAIGTDSNIASDRPGPQTISGNVDDLSRGSAGNRDGFIGSLELLAGEYSLVVTNRETLPQEFNQFESPGAGNVNVRIEPNPSVTRVSV
ncbi:MAG: hypothetical protein AAFN70_11550, partial [Planctomycetota bacterium]